jgi:hypothetical protein
MERDTTHDRSDVDDQPAALPTESRQGCTHRTENPITLGTGVVDEHVQTPGFTHHSLHGTLHGIRVDDIEKFDHMQAGVFRLCGAL